MLSHHLLAAIVKLLHIRCFACQCCQNSRQQVVPLVASALHMLLCDLVTEYSFCKTSGGYSFTRYPAAWLCRQRYSRDPTDVVCLITCLTGAKPTFKFNICTECAAPLSSSSMFSLQAAAVAKKRMFLLLLWGLRREHSVTESQSKVRSAEVAGLLVA